MRIGDEVIRVNGSFGSKEVGDISTITEMKVYNQSIVIRFADDKPGTWHGITSYRLCSDVDIPCLQSKIAHVKEKMAERMVKRTRLTDEAMVAKKAKRAATMRAKKGLSEQRIGIKDAFGDFVDDYNGIGDDLP